MTKWECEFETLLSQFCDRVRAKAKSLAKSGAVDMDSYESSLNLARLFLAASVEDTAPTIICFPTQQMIEDLENLKHF